MFWLLFFLIALLALAYRRAGIATSGWVLAGAIVFYGILGHSLGLFILFVLLWVIVFAPLLAPALRQEWLSRPAFNAFRRALQNLPAETTVLLGTDNPTCDAPLLDGAPDWPALRALPPPVLGEIQRAWLDSVVDAACTTLTEHPGDPAARARLAAAALGLVRGADGERNTEAGMAKDTAGGAVLRSAACARISGALGSAAWPLASPLRAGWLALLREEAQDGRGRDWLAQAEADPTAWAVASFGLDPVREAAGRASIASDPADADAGPGLRISLRHGLRADAAAAHYALLVTFSGSGKSPHGSACVILPADAPGLRVAPTPDGRVALSGETVYAPLSALLGGARHIGRGEQRLTVAMATARAIHAPALHLGQALQLALAGGRIARLHPPLQPPPLRQGPVRLVLADIAADLYAADALREWTLTNLPRNTAPVGLAAIADVQTAALATRIATRVRGLDQDGALAQLGTRQMPGVSALVGSQLGLRALGRCHPLLRRQIEAAHDPQPAQALEAFDAAFWAHLGHLFSNAVRALLAACGAGALLPTTGLAPSTARCLRRIDRACIQLALLVDLALFTQRGRLLRNDRLLAAIGNALAQLQLAKATLWRVQAAPGPAVAHALLRLTTLQALDAVQDECEALLRSLPAPLRGLARLLTIPLGRPRMPLHAQDDETAAAWLCDGDAQEQFAALLPTTLPEPAQRIRRALEACLATEPLMQRLRDAAPGQLLEAIATAEREGRLDAAQAAQLRESLDLWETVNDRGAPGPDA